MEDRSYVADLWSDDPAELAAMRRDAILTEAVRRQSAGTYGESRDVLDRVKRENAQRPDPAAEVSAPDSQILKWPLPELGVTGLSVAFNREAVDAAWRAFLGQPAVRVYFYERAPQYLHLLRDEHLQYDDSASPPRPTNMAEAVAAKKRGRARTCPRHGQPVQAGRCKHCR